MLNTLKPSLTIDYIYSCQCLYGLSLSLSLSNMQVGESKQILNSINRQYTKCIYFINNAVAT